MQASVGGEQTRTHPRGGTAQRGAFQLHRKTSGVSEEPQLLRLRSAAHQLQPSLRSHRRLFMQS